MTTKYLNANRYNTIKLNTINSIKKYLKKNPVLKNYIDNLKCVFGIIFLILFAFFCIGSVAVPLTLAFGEGGPQVYWPLGVSFVFWLLVAPLIKARFFDYIPKYNDD